MHEIALYVLLVLCGIWAAAGTLIWAMLAGNEEPRRGGSRKRIAAYLGLWVVHVLALVAVGYVLPGVN